jgi:uncharacterized membrane protein
LQVVAIRHVREDVLVEVAVGREGELGDGGSTPRGAAGGDEALRLLDERFARGEIDAEEFIKRGDLLRSR